MQGNGRRVKLWENTTAPKATISGANLSDFKQPKSIFFKWTKHWYQYTNSVIRPQFVSVVSFYLNVTLAAVTVSAQSNNPGRERRAG